MAPQIDNTTQDYDDARWEEMTGRMKNATPQELEASRQKWDADQNAAAERNRKMSDRMDAQANEFQM